MFGRPTAALPPRPDPAPDAAPPAPPKPGRWLKLLTSFATLRGTEDDRQAIAYDQGSVVYWADGEDAERIIRRKLAEPAADPNAAPAGRAPR